MSSGKGNSNSHNNPGSSGPPSKGKSTSSVSSPGVGQLSQDLSHLNLDRTEDDGWEVSGKKSKNRNASRGAKKFVPQTSNPPKAWGHSDTLQRLGMATSGGSGRGYGQNFPAVSSDSRRPIGRGNLMPQSSSHVSPPEIPPPKTGWDWSTRASFNQCTEDGQKVNPDVRAIEDGNDDDENEELDMVDDSDDEYLSDDFDSDESQKSHETRKKNRWFKELFECLDDLTVEQINDPERQWHCPACKGGPGAIDWYSGLQPLVTHAKTKRSKRVNLHRELAELLDEELHRRGTSVLPAGESFGKWKGLEERADKEIVWPPMVIVMNTRHEKNDNDKWTGMGNQELLDYFSTYAAVKARHSYGRQGHRGMSVLIFEASAVGYAEAERLSKQFEHNGKGRQAWEQNRMPFYPGGQRQLYGYMAERRDMDFFNQHSQGKPKLKYEMRLYQEMVVKQMQQMSEDNQQLSYFKNKVAREQKSKKALEESFGLMSEKLRKTLEENRIVRLKTKIHHEQKREEMDFQEQFFKDQIKEFYEARNAKEENFEKIQQEQRTKVTQSEANTLSTEDHQSRREKIAKFIQLQDKEMEEFGVEREKLVRAHEEKLAALRRKHLEEEVDLEKEFDDEFDRLLQKYSPHDQKQDTTK